MYILQRIFAVILVMAISLLFFYLGWEIYKAVAPAMGFPELTFKQFFLMKWIFSS